MGQRVSEQGTALRQGHYPWHSVDTLTVFVYVWLDVVTQYHDGGCVAYGLCCEPEDSPRVPKPQDNSASRQPVQFSELLQKCKGENRVRRKACVEGECTSVQAGDALSTCGLDQAV